MKKLLLVILICSIALVCFTQEKNEIPIVLMLTDGELKAILYYNETVEGFAQQVIEDKARDYMKELVKVHRKEDLEAIVNSLKLKPGKPKKWSGSGMCVFSTDETSKFDSCVDTLLTNGFTEIRVGIWTWNYPAGVAKSKAAAIRAVAKGAKVIWGVGQWDGTPEYPQHPPITAANWDDYRQAILDGAQWAQDNGIYEFQLGNEAESEIDGITITVGQLITNLKSVATEVQAIFTNGNVSYSCYHEYMDDWITAGKGDIDILASNIYMAWGTKNNPHPWQDEIDALVGTFGTDGTYLTEFGLNSSGLSYYSEDEAVQAKALTEMINYIRASGMTRAIYFCYKDSNWGVPSGFGVLKDDGIYRLLWDSLLSSN